jgi:hypothetical protein
MRIRVGGGKPWGKTVWLIDQLAEAHIHAALERGEFDDLPGAGKPLQLEDDRLVPEELRVAYRLLKNAGYLPPAVELLREIREAEDLLAAAQSDHCRDDATRRLNLLRARLGACRGERSLLLSDGQYLEQLKQRFENPLRSDGDG